MKLAVESGLVTAGPIRQMSRFLPKMLIVPLYFIIAAFYFWVNQEIRPVWLDEALTYYQVADRSFSDLIRSFDLGVNLLPYGYFVFPWAIGQFVELDSLPLRLPSLIFGILSLLVAHSLLARHFGKLIALFVVVVTFLVASDYSFYFAEARPYSLYMLAAGLHLYSSFKLASNNDRWSWCGNAITAALFPSVQFVGLVYSFAIAAALAISIKDRRLLFRKLSSYAVGWAIFLVIHAKLLWIIFSGKSLSDPDAFARPTITRVVREFNRFYELPHEISVCLIGLVAIAYAVKRLDCSEIEKSCRPKDIRFPPLVYIASCIAWLLVPLGLKLVAAVGFVNLTIPRYLLPTLYADAMATGLLLYATYAMVAQQIGSCATPRLQQHGNVASKSIIVAMLGFTLIVNMAIQCRVVSAMRIGGTEHFGRKLLINQESNLPFYTTDAHNFFAYAYHSRVTNSQNIYLVIGDEVIQSWREFAPEVHYMSVSDLLTEKEPFYLKTQNSSLADEEKDGLIERLRESGRELQISQQADDEALYYVNKRIE